MLELRAAPAPRLLLVLVIILMCAACTKNDAQTPAGGPKMPPVQVGVVSATPGAAGLVTELPGRVEAARVAQVRARVAGILQQRLFTEGSDVKAGQVLFRIDPAPYAATAQSAQASLIKAQARLAQASADLARYRPLVNAQAISMQDYANAEAAEQLARADVAVAEAAVRSAGIQLGYADVTAPISGRIGRSLVTEGALVGQGEATALALIQQINPVYVNFTQPASALLQLRRALASGQFQPAGRSQAASVRLVLDDGSQYAQTGQLLFTDVSVDPGTGGVSLRAQVPNPQGELLPGMYLRVRIEQAQAGNAITLPQQAVTRTQQGDSVSVVGADGQVSVRQVKIGAARDNRWVVLDGLKAGEQVIVDGFQKLQMLPPGATVQPVPWQPSAAVAAAPIPGTAKP